MIQEKQAPGDPELLRKCTDCKEEKAPGEFYRRSGGRYTRYLMSYCKSCANARSRRWTQENPEKTAVKKRALWLKRYNLTLADYDNLLAAQGGECAICGTDEPGGRGAFHVDHDHACCPGKGSCGKCVRGLLCNFCNRVLAAADPARLRKAADYLENFRALTSLS